MQKRTKVSLQIGLGFCTIFEKEAFLSHMSENRAFWVRYQNNQPVKIKLHSPVQVLEDVSDLIGAVKQALPSKLGSIDADELTLHLPNGVDRTALAEDCFATVDETDSTLDPGCLLSDLFVFGSKSKRPLVIKSRNDNASQNRLLIAEQRIL